MPSRPIPPLVSFFLITALFVSIFAPGFVRLQALKARERELLQKIQKLEQTIQELEGERHRLKTDPEYVEAVVRSELGRAKPGEVIYRAQKGAGT